MVDVEAFDAVEVFVGGEVGDDVGAGGVGWGRLLVGVDGVEAEKGVGLIGGYETSATVVG